MSAQLAPRGGGTGGDSRTPLVDCRVECECHCIAESPPVATTRWGEMVSLGGYRRHLATLPRTFNFLVEAEVEVPATIEF